MTAEAFGSYLQPQGLPALEEPLPQAPLALAARLARADLVEHARHQVQRLRGKGLDPIARRTRAADAQGLTAAARCSRMTWRASASAAGVVLASWTKPTGWRPAKTLFSKTATLLVSSRLGSTHPGRQRITPRRLPRPSILALAPARILTGPGVPCCSHSASPFPASPQRWHDPRQNTHRFMRVMGDRVDSPGWNKLTTHHSFLFPAASNVCGGPLRRTTGPFACRSRSHRRNPVFPFAVVWVRTKSRSAPIRCVCTAENLFVQRTTPCRGGAQL